MAIGTQGEAALTVTQVSANNKSAFFILPDGSLWAMGDNSFGQLGPGALGTTKTPVMIVSNGIVAVSVGYLHSGFL